MWGALLFHVPFVSCRILMNSKKPSNKTEQIVFRIARVKKFTLIYLASKIILGISLCFSSRWAETLSSTLGATLFLVLCECVCLFSRWECIEVFFVRKTYHARRQRGEIQQLLVLLKGEKLQRKDRDEWAVRKTQRIKKRTSLHT